MSKQVNWLLAAVVVLLLGVTCWLAQTAPAVAAMPQDERPPIVIYEGSIHFNFGAGWISHATKGWWIANLKSDPQGPTVSDFDAIATATTPTSKNICLISGPQLTIDYAEGSQTWKFILVVENGAAVLKPPAEAPLKAARRWNLRTANAQKGAITGAAAGGKSCSFTGAENVRIVVKLKP